MFQKNKIELLIKRAISCKPSIWLLKKEDIAEVARQLGVCFSDDFLMINEQYSYECLYGACIEFLCLYDNRDGYSGVITKTQKFRQEMHLPNRYVVLSYSGDTRFILMETQDDPRKASAILWIEPEDFENLCNEKTFEYEYEIWPSFTDFFEYLVEQEEMKLQGPLK